jgi:hypothetical protein
MIIISHNVAVSNGQDMSGKTKHEGSMKDGTKYHIGLTVENPELRYGQSDHIYILETEYICDPSDNKALAKAIEDGKFERFPLRAYNGRDLVHNFQSIVFNRITNAKHAEERNQKVQALQSKYHRVPSEIFELLSRLDWHYDYTDDINVWRAAKDRHDTVKQKLTELNAIDLYKDYNSMLG